MLYKTRISKSTLITILAIKEYKKNEYEYGTPLLNIKDENDNTLLHCIAKYSYNLDHNKKIDTREKHEYINNPTLLLNHTLIIAKCLENNSGLLFYFKPKIHTKNTQDKTPLDIVIEQALSSSKNDQENFDKILALAKFFIDILSLTDGNKPLILS